MKEGFYFSPFLGSSLRHNTVFENPKKKPFICPSRVQYIQEVALFARFWFSNFGFMFGSVFKFRFQFVFYTENWARVLVSKCRFSVRFLKILLLSASVKFLKVRFGLVFG